MTKQAKTPADVTRLDLQAWLTTQQKLLVALKDESPQRKEEVEKAEECVAQIKRWLGC